MSNAMAFLVRLVFFLVVVGVVGGASGLLMRLVFPKAWTRVLRRVWIAGGVVTLATVLVWFAGRALELRPLIQGTAPLVAVFLMGAFFVLLTSPVWGLLGAGARALPVDENRRAFLTKAVGAVPATAALAGPVGALSSGAKPILRRIEMRSPLLPPALDGLRILQVSDVHLGPFIGVEHVEAVVEEARGAEPHLVALTGDIADDYALLPPAMAALRTLAAPLGMLAILGNHEYYRGRDEAVRLFREGGARFLCDDGVVLDHGGARFFVAGVDDPAHHRGKAELFYAERVARAAGACPAGVDCRILLAHRPFAFDAAAAHRFAVQLSGHTHGGQMALFGRSLLEGLVPMKYMLGRYEKNETALYTTAGLGHWFPFRLNCPTEAALVTLRAGR